MRYQVKAVAGNAEILALSLDAADESDAALQVKNRGYSVLTIKAGQTLPVFSGPAKSRFPLLLFTQELLALLDAGLSLIEAMEALAEKEARGQTKQILTQIIVRLYEGKSLSSALQHFPKIFPALYVATVRASEKTGNLGEALERFAAYRAQSDIVRKKIISASIYPVLLIVVGGLITAFLMGYVVPRFSGIYENSRAELPWLSLALLNWGKLLQAHAASAAAGLIAGLAGLAYALTRPAVRQWTLAQLWKMPAVGERMRIYQLARFYRTAGMLLRGGIPVVTALTMVADLLQPGLRNRLQLAAQDIREGKSTSHAMEQHRLTTPVISRMLRVGERTGKMGDMMERIASFYDEEMARWVDWFTRLFEPLLMALIGLVIGVIVILMYMPIFELAGSLE